MRRGTGSVHAPISSEGSIGHSISAAGVMSGRSCICSPKNSGICGLLRKRSSSTAGRIITLQDDRGPM